MTNYNDAIYNGVDNNFIIPKEATASRVLTLQSITDIPSHFYDMDGDSKADIKKCRGMLSLATWLKKQGGELKWRFKHSI